MRTIAYPIEIYRDEQDPQNPGWAWRDDREGSPLGSGSIDGDASDALDAILAGDELSPRQRDALDAILRDEIGCPRAAICMEPIGALWPAEELGDSLPWRMAEDSATGALDGPMDQQRADLRQIIMEAGQWAEQWASPAADRLADEAAEILREIG